jgi:xanthine/CO dehydrogenase XdhC/CoxF family maturation factor
MLLTENGKMTGAVSGGCVEKEVLQQASSVFKTGKPKMMTYDGRYRLGCEGILYILIEPFHPEKAMLKAFETCLKERNSFKIHSYFSKEIKPNENLGSIIEFTTGEKHSFHKNIAIDMLDSKLELFSQTLKPSLNLIIIGAEHDAVQLSQAASFLGWDVTIVAGLSEAKTIQDFPGAKEMITQDPEFLQLEGITQQTVIVVMTHSYVKDLTYLLALKDSAPAYIGLLGPVKRRNQLLNEFIERYPVVQESFLDLIHGPAGLNIGAETPQEIAISICAEILTVIRNYQPKSLRDKKGSIHCDIS